MESKFAELTFVKETATGRGLNQKCIMEETGDGNFKVTEMRVGIRVGRNKPYSYVRPISDWDAFLAGKKRKGFLVTSTKRRQQIRRRKSGYAAISDERVRQFIHRLRQLAQIAMEENFIVKVDDISPEMIAYGREVIKALAEGAAGGRMSTAEFNNKLKILYSAIPRRIDKLSDRLAKTKADYGAIVQDELETFEFMVQMVQGKDTEAIGSRQTILESEGLTCRAVDEGSDEEMFVKRQLGRLADKYVGAYKCENRATREAFEGYLRSEGLSDDSVSLLKHGSRTENWWNIFRSGLTINPSGVVITGKAYGMGTYFAPSAQKSMGYMSVSGSKWAGGCDETGYMGLYSVITGDSEHRYPGTHGVDCSLDWNKLQKIQPGAYCTWAESRYSGFMMDEVIVYKDCQSTIEYIVELAA